MSKTPKSKVVLGIINLLLALSILLGIWQASLWLYDSLMDNKTLRQQHALEKAGGSFRWDFDSPRALKGAYHIDQYQWQNGLMEGDISGAAGRVSNSDFWLNLNGRFIDTTFLRQVNLRLYSETENEVYFFHQQVNSDALHGSQRIRTKPGWQVISLDMSQLHWTREDGFEKVYVFEASTWGGTNEVATLFGLSPSKAGKFKVDWLEISSDFPEGLDVLAPMILSSESDPRITSVFEQRNKIWQLVHGTPFRYAEKDFLFRQAVKQGNPNALVYSAGFVESKSSLSQNFILIVPMMMGVVFTFALTLLFMFKQTAYAALLQLLVLITGMGTLAWTYTILENWQFMIELVIFLSLLYYLRPHHFNFSVKSPWTSWVLVVMMTILPMILLMTYSDSDFFDYYQPDKALLAYMLWALLQQFIFLGFILPRCQSLQPQFAIVICAGLFSFVHLPNFSLMCATFLMGMVWFFHYERYRNWYAIAFSHAFMAVFFREVAPEEFRLSGEVGLMFLSKLGALG